MEVDDGLLSRGWRWLPVGELCERVSVGYVSSTRAFFCAPGEGVRLVRSQNIRPGRLILDDTAWVTRSFHDSNPKSQLRAGDVLFTRVGANAGDVCIVPDDAGELHLSSAVFARPLREHRKYIELFFRSPVGQDLLKSRIVGSVSERINTRDVEALLVLVPSAKEEGAIASILGTFDAKIELNRKMSATLEAIARALFKSWFVDFDPVRAKAEGRDPGLPAEIAALFPDSFEDSELGQIPGGWRVDSLKNAIRIFDSKRIPLSGRERAARTGRYPYYGAASVMGHIDDFIFSGVHLLIGEDGSVIRDDGTPVLQYIWGEFWVNNHAHVVVGDGAVSTEQIYMFLQQTNIQPYVTGAVQPKLNQGNLFRVPFLRAPDSILSRFADIVSPLFERIRLSSDESRTLAALRDALLPKLISGELRVGGAERVVAASA